MKTTFRASPKSNLAIETHPVVAALVSRYDGPVHHWIEANLGPLDLTPGPFRMPIVCRGIAFHPERKYKQAIQAVVKDAKELARLLTGGDEARAVKLVQGALRGRDVDFSKHTLVVLSRGSTERQLDLDAIETYTLGEKFKQTQTLRDSLRIRDGSVLVNWQVRDLGAAKEAEHPLLILLVPRSNHPYQFEAPVIREEK